MGGALSETPDGLIGAFPRHLYITGASLNDAPYSSYSYALDYHRHQTCTPDPTNRKIPAKVTLAFCRYKSVRNPMSRDLEAINGFRI
jgi:hypothetical protein